MDTCADLRTLLFCDADALAYYEGLPAPLRAALRGHERIASMGELQSFVADEREL